MNKLSTLDILKKYTGSNWSKVMDSWREPHRKFHTEQHLSDVICGLEKQRVSVKGKEWEALILAAYFHDIVYVPGGSDNEEKSAEKFDSLIVVKNNAVTSLARKIILDTKKLGIKEGVFNVFQSADCWGLIHWNFEQILPYEERIFKEFQRFSWGSYKKGRVDFLRGAAKTFIDNEDTLNSLADYVNARKPRIGVYAGSFRPFTTGHLNVLQQAEAIFDKVVVAFGTNPDKEDTAAVVPTSIQDRECVVYSGLLPDLLKNYEDMGCEVTLVRGLRNEYDLNYEQNLIQYMKDMMPSLKVVLLLCDREFEHVSSGAVRGLRKSGAEVAANKYVVL